MPLLRGSFGAVACAFATAAAALPNNGSSNAGKPVQEALAQHNLWSAGIALSSLVEARLPPVKDVGKPDPLLDRLFADLFAANGQLSLTGTMLRRIVSDPSTPDLDHYRLLLATYEESTGDWPEAQRQYHQIATDPKASVETALSATLGIARLQMAADPAVALATLAGIDSKRVPPSMAWEVDLLIERAASMAGSNNRTIARAALDRAWAEAPQAAIGDSAVARVAGDHALAAGRAGDRKMLITMLAVDRASRMANTGQPQLVSDLPICGTNGITPQDVVSIDVAHQAPANRPSVTLVWASRPGIAAPFLLAAERSGSLTVSDGQIATFNLRCRTVPSSDYVVRNSIEEDIAGWMTGLGAYPEANQRDGGTISSLATGLAQRQARYGVNSVMLLPLLFGTMAPGAIDFTDPSGMKKAAANADHILAILQQNDAPASLTLMWRLSSIEMAVLAQTKTVADGQAEIQALLGSIAADPALSLDTLYMLTMNTAQMHGLPSDFKLTMLNSVLKLLDRKVPAGDQRRAAIALRLYQLRKSNADEKDAQAAIARIGLPKDACVLSDPPPNYVSSNIASADYPGDLIFMTIPGLSYTEFDLDAAGNARNGRLLLEDPPYAFDQIALARIPTIHYDPARFDGKISSCRAMTQSIRWQIPGAYGM